MMPKMNLSQEFERALALARITMRFGQVRRVTLHEDGEPESDTTHTVMLTLVGIEMAPLVGCDPGLVAQFAAVHDLPETYAGDTNTARGLSPAQVEEKASREARAIERLHEEIGGSPVLALLRRYEAQQEPEARLVRYLDKVMPKLTHFLNRGLALAALGLTTSDVREKHATQGAQLATQYPELASVRRLFEEACSAVEANVMDHPLVATGEEHRDNNECSACGATFSWNEGTDRDEPNQICNPCAQQIASAARTSEVIADALDALREQATKPSGLRIILRKAFPNLAEKPASDAGSHAPVGRVNPLLVGITDRSDAVRAVVSKIAEGDRSPDMLSAARSLSISSVARLDGAVSVPATLSYLVHLAEGGLPRASWKDHEIVELAELVKKLRISPTGSGELEDGVDPRTGVDWGSKPDEMVARIRFAALDGKPGEHPPGQAGRRARPGGEEGPRLRSLGPVPRRGAQAAVT